MVDVYATLIVAGRREYSKVPKNLQPAVKEALKALGLGTDGKPLTVSIETDGAE